MMGWSLELGDGSLETGDGRFARHALRLQHLFGDEV